MRARPARLALGTVQFGMPYGVANTQGQVAPDVAAAILRRAAAAGMDVLDTAIGYGASESVLGGCGVARWRIVSKLPPLPDDVSDVSSWVAEAVAGSLRRLRVERLDAILLHRSSDLLGARGPAYRDALAVVRRAGLAGAVGVSIYAPAELDALWPVFKPDLVQAPLNVLDRRLIRSGWLDRLEGAGVRVHTRSSFLQGLLLMPADRRPSHFRPWAQLLDAWVEWCRVQRCPPLHAALRFVLAQAGIERTVVGVESTTQLDEILAAAGQDAPPPPADLYSDDPALIEPSRWARS